MKTFINPYTFVPTSSKANRASQRVPVDSVKKVLFDGDENEPREPAVQAFRHDRYTPSSFTGRIVCRLTTRSPCVFGGHHSTLSLDGKEEKDCPTVVHPFKIENEVAIPGTSLRGMISSIVESASGSAMRVLTNRLLTIRSSMTNSRSAIGMVFVHNDRKWILPLTYPNLKPNKNRDLIPIDGSHATQWEKIEQQMRSQSSGSAFLGFPIYTEISPEIAGCKCDSFHSGNREVVAIRGIDDPVFLWVEDGKFEVQNKAIEKWQNNRLRLVRPAKLAERPRLEAYDPTDSNLFPGILRILPEGTENKRHNLFIPVPRTWVKNGKFEPPPVGLLEAEDAIQQFEQVLNEKHVTIHNNELEPPCQTLLGQADHLTELKHGDLVHFRLSKRHTKTGLPIVDTVAISSVWREGAAYLWEDESHQNSRFANDIVAAEQRPFDKHRQTVTIAERLFGWVTQDKADEQEDTSEAKDLKAYRSRIRVSNAILAANQEDVLMQNQSGSGEWGRFCNEYQVSQEYRCHFPLQILASPKPPCPEFYFTGNGKVEDFRNNFFVAYHAEHHQIRGAKFYWNHKKANDTDATYWTTRHLFDSDKIKANLNQKAVVQPVRKNIDFYFHVDFENLTEDELNLLCFALRPNQTFLHKLGFAKPLGLGSVQLEAVEFVVGDRCREYQTVTNLVPLAKNPIGQGVADEQSVKLPARYQNFEMEIESDLTADEQVLVRSAEWCKELDDIRAWFKKLGAPVGADSQLGVVYPQAREQRSELELFKWFTTNRDSSKRSRRVGGEQTLPQLDRDPRLKTNLKNR